METTKRNWHDCFPTAAEAADKVKQNRNIKQDCTSKLIDDIKETIQGAINNRQYEVHTSLILSNYSSATEEPLLKATVLTFFNERGYDISDWKIATYHGHINKYTSYVTERLYCRISWSPK